MVARGTYNELQSSGLDFTSLLKKDEEEEEQPRTETSSQSPRRRALSQNSLRSQTSSLHSAKEGEEDLPVGTLSLNLGFVHANLSTRGQCLLTLNTDSVQRIVNIHPISCVPDQVSL